MPSTSVTMVTPPPGDAGGSGGKVVDGKAGAAMQPTEIKLRDGKWVIPLVILAGKSLFDIGTQRKNIKVPVMKERIKKFNEVCNILFAISLIISNIDIYVREEYIEKNGR